MKRTPEPPKEKLMLYIPREFKIDRDEYQVFELHFVVLRDSKVRNPSFGENHVWADLGFRCQHGGTSADTPGQGTYGADLAYRNITLDYPEMLRCVPMIKRIAAIKLPINPATFGQFVGLMCIALKVQGAVQQGHKIDGATGWGYDEDSYNTWQPHDIAWLVDTRVDECLAKRAARLAA